MDQQTVETVKDLTSPRVPAGCPVPPRLPGPPYKSQYLVAAWEDGWESHGWRSLGDCPHGSRSGISLEVRRKFIAWSKGWRARKLWLEEVDAYQNRPKRDDRPLSDFGPCGCPPGHRGALGAIEMPLTGPPGHGVTPGDLGPPGNPFGLSGPRAAAWDDGWKARGKGVAMHDCPHGSKGGRSNQTWKLLHAWRLGWKHRARKLADLAHEKG